MKKIQILFILALSLTLLFCKKEKDTTFLINKERVGKLLRTSKATEIDSIFQGDSIVREETQIAIGSFPPRFNIYEKGGKHLLTLTPNKDSLATIGLVRVYDNRYLTEEGIGLLSTFSDIKKSYEIKKIVTSLNNVVIFIENKDFYFTIDKEELPASLRYDTSLNIEAVQIPDVAKIKYLMVGWD
ncbi:hypothetical protein [Eudoraea chungangensis]|uniref:hypothetical protein n=1 Tax=Eudoraea chungangensis TaxID=1481905 RepID=UPI0023EC4BBD|nr:hypothetical protein [Eudoraea chungangensis]